MTKPHNLVDLEPTMSRFVKIATASATILALLGLGVPAVAASTTAGGGAGCCWSTN